MSGIYPSSFSSVHYCKKIEFSNVVFCEKRSQNYPTRKVGAFRHCKLCGGSMAERGKSVGKKLLDILRLEDK